jgi:SAM-dependent methyltransferase
MDALERTAQWLAEEGLSATLKRVDMTVIPYPDGFFDAVISLYVLHHNTIANIRTALSEIRRTLRPGGLFFATLVATGDFKEGRGQLIEPRTWVVEEQGYEDGVPHHFFTEDEIRAVLEGFRLIELERGERSFVEEATGHLVLSAHWEVWAERRKGDKNHLHGHATIRRARS